MSVFLSTNCARNVEYFAMEVPGPDGSKCEAYDLSISPASGSLAPGETVNFNLSSAPSSTANPGDACDAKISVFMPLYDGTFIPVVSFWFFDRIVSPATLTCSASAGSTAPGAPVTITGALDPGLAQTIALSYTDPTGLVKNRTLLTNAEGIYSDQFTPDLTGPWNVQAMWVGDDTHAPAESTLCRFNVAEIITPTPMGPSPTPLAPTFTPTPTALTFIPNINAYCRSGPGPSFTSDEIAMKGQPFLMDGRNLDNTWYRIMITASRGCWVPASSGSPSSDPSRLRVLAEVPTFTPTSPPVDIITPTPPLEDYCSQFTSFGICQIAHSESCIWDDPAGVCTSK